MQSHRDNKNYLKWNLEDTARIIQKGFLDSHVVVVRPSRYAQIIFFEYYNSKCTSEKHFTRRCTSTKTNIYTLKSMMFYYLKFKVLGFVYL